MSPNNENGQSSTQTNHNSTMANAHAQGNALPNQPRRPSTVNPYNNNRTTAMNVSTLNSSTNTFGYSNHENLQQGNNHHHHLQQRQQQQRPPVNNPYNKSMTSASTVSHHSNNVPRHNVLPSNTFVAPRQNQQQQRTETTQQVLTNPTNSRNATNSSNVATNSQQNNNQNLHRFFTGARPATAVAQSSQRPHPQIRTSMSVGGNTNNNNALPAAASTSSTNNSNRQQQRFSLSAKKQLPYIEGPVPLCPATSHNWIYPTDDKYPERTYQLEMSESAIFYNTLVSLPTGLGKTLIAAVVMYNYYRWFPDGKVIFCAPTRPLVTQQIQACYKIMGIPERHTAEISGRVPNTSRKKIWDTKRVFFCTPQTLVKDIEEDRCDASKIVCVVMDEAHRATGMHTFALLPDMIEQAGAKFRLVALSGEFVFVTAFFAFGWVCLLTKLYVLLISALATPGTDIKSIQAVVETLKISKIEARTEDDPNVKRYIHNREEEVISVKQPDVIKILDKKLLEFVRQPLEKLRSVNAASRLMGDSANLSPFAVMKAQEEYVNRTGDHRMYHTFQALRSLVDVRINLKNHGVQYALQNIARKEMEARGPLRVIFHSDEFKALKAEMQTAAGDPTECLSKNNPKYEKLTDVLLEHFERKRAIGESTRVIVFSQLRESVMGIVSMLSSKNAALLKPTPFVGQSKKKESESNPGQEVAGMNQAEQQRILRQFNEGVYNILVCTCVGEEGLDIGDVDLIVNFDILKSAIRSIQRTGRTGRKRNGRVIFLVSEGQEERSYRDSVTNSKKIARALKDPSVFKLCQNSPMFPDEPALLRQKMVVDDFHMSQVGGHTPKVRGRGKAGRSSKRNGDKIAAADDSWRLDQDQQKERMSLFGNLPYSSHSKYESETMLGDFPISLRKKYLKARRGLQQSKNTGRGRTSTILASMEKLYRWPAKRNESSATPRTSPFDYSDDDMNSVGNANHSVTFDVDSDCGFAEDHCNGNEPSDRIIASDDDHQNGCNEVSPESNTNDLGAIFGTMSVKHSDCLDSQQLATLFDSDDHIHCSVRAPPPFGDLQYNESSDFSDESSYLSSQSSKQSQLSVNAMNDDELCAFFDNSPLPTASQRKPAVEMRQGSIGEECDGDNSVDNEVGDEVDFNDDVDDSRVSSDVEVEPREEKESDCKSKNTPKASFEDNAELDSSVLNEKAQNTSKHTVGNEGGSIGISNLSSNVGNNKDESLFEFKQRVCDHIDPEILDSIGGNLSPIVPLSQVAAFRLPTPPPSSSDEDDEDVSYDCSDANDDVEAEGNVLSVANGQDLTITNSSLELRSSPPLEIDDGREHSTEFEQNQYFGKIDVQEEYGCKDKIDPLQLPTQYSSSSDDDDESESESTYEAVAHMQVLEPYDVAPAAASEIKNNNQFVRSEQKYAIGTKIAKEFKDPMSGKLRMYRGEIIAFYSQDNQEKLYNVVFEDGDCEDMEEGEIESHLASIDPPTEEIAATQAQQHPRSQMSPDDLTDTPVKANVRAPAGAILRMSLDNSLDSLIDTPVVQRMPAQHSRMSLDSLTDTPVVQRRAPERKSRMSMDSLTDTPIQQMPERKRLRPTNDVPKAMSKPSEKLSRQDRLKQRIEEKYRCKFLDTEAANDDSDSGDEEEEDDDDMSNDGFINDTSQLGYSQDDLDRLNESVEDCDLEESDVLHRQLNHQQSVNNQFKTPVFNRRMQLSTSEQSQTSLPPSQRGLGNMNFIRSVIDHCRKGGDSDEIEAEYHRLVGESSQDMPMSQTDERSLVQQAEAEVRQKQPPPMASNTISNNNPIRVGLGSQQVRKCGAMEPATFKQNATVEKKTQGLTAEQKAMIEAKRQAALRLRQQKQMQRRDQQQTQLHQQQVRFNPYAK
eukprot:scaffold27039_cov150-Skeletonema_menzelii.AAC.1